MRVGSVSYATSRGLGHLCKAFYDHGIVTDVCVVRHPGVPTNEDWYPGAPSTALGGGWDGRTVRAFCREMDAVLFFETPFEWALLDFCREVGVRTYLITMYECTPIHHPHPTRYFCPSTLDLKYFPVDRSVLLPLPVEYPWKLRERAQHYIHNGGYLGIRGREGTTLLIEAMQHVQAPLRLTIRVQENVAPKYQQMMARDPRIEYLAATIPYKELYATGDVCVQPQKWNGCSLPLQEAHAAGLLVMTTDRAPMNEWLPREPLIPVSGYKTDSQIGGAYLRFDEAMLSPRMIAQTMDAWYDRDIDKYSRAGKTWAEANSWEVLGPRYLEELSR